MASLSQFYVVLGVSEQASEQEIKLAYRKLAMRYHPDRTVNLPERERQESEAKFKEIQVAYDILTNPEKQRAYLEGNAEAFNDYGFDFSQFGFDFSSSQFDFGARSEQYASKEEAIEKMQSDYANIRDSIDASLNGIRQREKERQDGGESSLYGNMYGFGKKDKLMSVFVPLTVAVNGGELVLSIADEDGKTISESKITVRPLRIGDVIQGHPINIEREYSNHVLQDNGEIHTTVEVSLHDLFITKQLEVNLIRSTVKLNLDSDMIGKKIRFAGYGLGNDLYLSFNLKVPSKEELLLVADELGKTN